jgi:hypothetical protein
VLHPIRGVVKELAGDEAADIAIRGLQVSVGGLIPVGNG